MGRMFHGPMRAKVTVWITALLLEPLPSCIVIRIVCIAILILLHADVPSLELARRFDRFYIPKA